MALSSTSAPADIAASTRSRSTGTKWWFAMEISMSSSTHDTAVQRLAALAKEALALTESLMQDEAASRVADRTAQQLVTAAAKLYARKVDAERRYFPPVTAP